MFNQQWKRQWEETTISRIYQEIWWKVGWFYCDRILKWTCRNPAPSKHITITPPFAILSPCYTSFQFVKTLESDKSVDCNQGLHREAEKTIFLSTRARAARVATAFCWIIMFALETKYRKRWDRPFILDATETTYGEPREHQGHDGPTSPTDYDAFYRGGTEGCIFFSTKTKGKWTWEDYTQDTDWTSQTSSERTRSKRAQGWGTESFFQAAALDESATS